MQFGSIMHVLVEHENSFITSGPSLGYMFIFRDWSFAGCAADFLLVHVRDFATVGQMSVADPVGVRGFRPY